MRFFQKLLSVLRCSVLFFFVKEIKFKNFFFIGKGVKFNSSSSSRILFEGKIKLDDNVEIGGSGALTCGDHLVVNAYSRIIAEKEIEIGRDVLIARFVTILDHDHDLNSVLNGDFDKLVTKKIKIGNSVWIGDKVTILKGVTIGDNVLIGANSVVTKDIPSNSIAVGAPCKVIKKINS